MMKEVIQVNQRVELEAFVRGEWRRYPSRIEGVSDRLILLAAPLKSGVLEPVSIGSPIRAVIIHQGRVFEFESVVVDRHRGDIPYLVVEWPQELTVANRRAFFRLDVLLNMNYALLESEEEVEELLIPQKPGLIKNLSGSGLLVWVEDEDGLAIGSRMVVDIQLPEASDIVLARVVRKEEVPDDHRGRVAVGLDIEEINPAFQDAIIRYLFEQQRERRNKGIL
ncbi:MAG: flagellar brake protein [Firmicutes bacterium]|nr:flagellar brake protein [Bacillota bacterium]